MFRVFRRLADLLKPRPVAQPTGLISVLLDPNAPFGDRHDAAMDLSAYDEIEAEHALAAIACNAASDPDLAEESAESLGLIWLRNGRIAEDIFCALPAAGQDLVLCVLSTAPELRARAEALRK